MKKTYIIIVSILCFNINLAQQKKDSIKIVPLSEVIVTGNLKIDPIHTFVKNDYQKKVVQPKNVADLFSEINGFSVLKRGNYAVDPVFRASFYEQLNVMYDGGTKAVHACPNRMDPITTHIIPEEIEKIEVIKGPYTVRYGTTFGGIVNMVTKDYSNYQKGFHGKTSVGYETNGNSLVGMLQLQYITDKFDIVGNTGYRNFGNYKDGNGTEIPSSFKSTDYGVKLGYNITQNQRLQAHWRQSFGRDVKHAALPMDTETDDSSILSLDYTAKNIGKSLKTIIAKGFYSYVDHLMTNANRPNFKMVFASSPVESTTAGGKLELHWLFNQKINFYAGTDLNQIQREGNRTRTIKMMNGTMLATPMIKTDKIWQDAFINDLGVFSEIKYPVFNKTFLTAGIRIDFVNADVKDVADDFAQQYNKLNNNETNISGTLSIKHVLSNNTVLEVAFGRGVRPANMTERYINHFTIGQDSYEYLGNPELKPEINNQFEIGLKGKINVSDYTEFSYQTSAYYSIFNNYIVGVVNKNISRKFMPTQEPKFTKVFQNIEDAYKTGVELTAKVNFVKDYFVKADVTYVYTQNKDFGESLPLNPPFITKFSTGVEKEKYWLTANFNIVSKQTNIAKSFGETETAGYQTLDVKLGIKPFKKITLGISCLNIFDKNYTNHLNFSYRNQADFSMTKITEPGRNFTAFLQYKF